MSESWSPSQGRPHTPTRPRGKRARPSISCLECRRKKLRCDRVQPCMQCKKSRREALCSFANGPPLARPGPAVNIQPRLEQATPLQARGYGAGVAGSLPHGSHSETPIPDRFFQGPDADTCDASPLGSISVKGARSRYLGLGDRMAMLGYFEEAKDFIMKSFSCGDTISMMQEMSIFQRLTVRKCTVPESIYSSYRGPALIVEMLKCLPRKYSWDDHFSAMPYWESLTRVLHVPSFRIECNEIFKALGAGIDTLPPSVRGSLVPQLLATLALSARLATATKCPDNDTISEGQIGIYTILIEKWMNDLNSKERLNIYSLQTQTLLLLVHQNNNASPSALWKESGDLVRSAMIMGLHLEPEEYPEFCLFQREQRRKLWRTIVELDIQFSLAASMPTALRVSDFQLRDLINADDTDLAEEMAEYPTDKGHQIWTDAIAQIALGQSLRERLDAVNRLGGNVNLDTDASSLLHIAAELERSSQTLPIPAPPDPAFGSINDRAPGRYFANIMLDVFIRRPSLAIYRTIALSAQRSRYPEARKAAIRSSIALLSHLDALDPAVADLNVIRDRDLLNRFHVLCKNDIMQSAHFLCYEIQQFSELDEPQNAHSPGDDTTWTKHSLTRVVENTLNSLIQRLGQFGSDLKDVLPLSVVLQSVRSGGTIEEKVQLLHRGAERVWRACRTEMPQIKDIAERDSNESGKEKYPTQPAVPTPPESWGTAGSGFGDANLLYTDVDFQDIGIGLNDWDMNQSWF